MLVAAIVAASAAGCGGAAGPPPELAVLDAWARPTPAGADEGVVYLTLTSDRDDALIEVSVDPDVAAEAQLHQTTGGGDGGGHEHGAVGGGTETVAMGEVAELAVGPDAPLVFEPGGSHVMLVGLVAPLVEGDRVPLVLELASGRSLAVAAPVLVNPPGS